MANKNIIKDQPEENQTDQRYGRVMESRRFEMRDAEIRAVLEDAYSDPLHIPKSLIKEGYDYHWVRDSYVGHIDNSRMAQMNKKGWVPVSADRHLEMLNMYIPGRESPLSSFVHHRGLILCDRPSKWGVIERELEEKRSYEAMVKTSVAQSMVSEDMKRAGWETKVLQNQTYHEQEYRTFKD